MNPMLRYPSVKRLFWTHRVGYGPADPGFVVCDFGPTRSLALNGEPSLAFKAPHELKVDFVHNFSSGCGYFGLISIVPLRFSQVVHHRVVIQESDSANCAPAS